LQTLEQKMSLLEKSSVHSLLKKTLTLNLPAKKNFANPKVLEKWLSISRKRAREKA